MCATARFATSAGRHGWYSVLSLALIAEDLGDDIARKVAQQLVVYHAPPGRTVAVLSPDRNRAALKGDSRAWWTGCGAMWLVR